MILEYPVGLFSFSMQYYSSLLVPDIQLHLIFSSINVISRQNNAYNLMIDILVQNKVDINLSI